MDDQVDSFVIDGGTESASDLKTMMSKRIEKFGRVEIKGTTVRADQDQVDLRNLVGPDADVLFEKATFLAPLMLEGARFSKLVFKDCKFAAVQTGSAHDPASKAVTGFSLGLQGVQVRHLHLELGESTLGAESAGVFRLEATNCEVVAHLRIIRLKNVCADRLVHLSLENARIGQTGFGGDLIIDDNCPTHSAGGLILQLNRARIRGDFLVEGCRNPATPLGINAADLRVVEEMRLRNITFLNTQPDGDVVRPAINLVRAHIGRLVLHDDIRALFPQKLNENIPWAAFKSRQSEHSSNPGLAEISVGRVGFIHDSNTVEDGKKNKQGEFWRSFISRVSDPEKRIIDADGKINSNSATEVSKTDTGRFRRTLTEFADALSGGRAWKSSDVLRTVEKKIEIRLERRGRNWLEKWKWLVSYLPLLILVSVILLAFFAPGFPGNVRGFEDPWFTWNIKPENALVVIGTCLLLVIFALPALLLWSSRWRPWFTEWVEYLFRRASLNAIADGISPLHVLAYVLALWGFVSILFTAAAYRGLMAPDHPDIFHSEFELLMVQEISDLGDFMIRTDSGSNGSGSVIQEANMQWFLDRSETLFNHSLHDLEGAGAMEIYKDKKDQADKFFWNIPLGAYHVACRLNWARPGNIDKRDWARKIQDRYKADYGLSEGEQTTLLEGMDPKKICERILPAEYSMFEPTLYALDVVIPLLDLRQEEQWSIRVAEPHTGERNYLAFFLVIAEAICMTIGWLFALVVAGAVTGLSDPNRRPN